jgi:hypothetical protein
MKQNFKLSPKLLFLSGTLILIGIITFIWGFVSDSERTWANYLLNNYYFLSIAVGGTFWLALQRVSQSGWSSGFIRIPEAFANFIPVAAVLFIAMWIGFHHLYEWTHLEVVEQDPILAHKAPYLNIGFFMIRMIIFFVAWIIMTQLMRKVSRQEDLSEGLEPFEKNEWYSKVYIFILAITFSIATFDWIMSIEPHWYSTIFSLKNFLAAFYHGSATIVLIIIIMHKYGYFPFINRSHMIDLSKYIFILSIIWGYFWFSQYLLMWYANIPEETVYYVKRIEGPYSTLFWLDIILNTAVPFVVLLSNYLAKSKFILGLVAVVLMFGQWIDLYLQIMPGATHYKVHTIGFIEVGTYLGYLGLFILVVAWSMSKRPLIPLHHPYLEESTDHHLHEV